MFIGQLYYYIIVVVLQTVFNFNVAYKNVRPQDFLCADKLILTLQKPFRGDPTLILAEDRNSAAIINQVWNSTYIHGHRSNKIKYDCQFRVRTVEMAPHGIYTAITKLKFRTNLQTNSCVDFIEFSSSIGSHTARFCNDILLDGPDKHLIIDQPGEVTVRIHIDKTVAIEKPLELNMVMTAHARCKYKVDIKCNPDDPASCISRYFYKDNITNCMSPYRDEVDEVDAANVAISAITSLIFTMLGVGFCIWICWKYWKCITVQQRAHEESVAHRRAAQMDVPTVEVPMQLDIDEPRHDHQLQTPKDLPPSYESLFPDR